MYLPLCAAASQRINLRMPFDIVYTDDKQPQRHRHFADECDPQKVPQRIRDLWQREKEHEAVDPISHPRSNHQEAENSRKEPGPKDEVPNQPTEHAKER